MNEQPSRLANLLACPSCRSADVRWHATGVECAACGADFRLVHGVPVLLGHPPPGRRPGETSDPGLLPFLPARWRPFAERSKRFVRPQLTHRSGNTRSLTRRFVDRFDPGRPILNVGAGTSDYGPNVVNLDISPDPGIHVVGLAEELPFRDDVFEGVVFQAALEHVLDSRQALAEIWRVLRPGGTVFVEVPFIQGYHPTPLDHRRFTEPGLRAELEQHGFAVDETGVAVGPASAMAWVAAEFLALLLSGRSARLYRIARVGTTWLAWPVKWADAWLERHEMAHVIASGVWARAHKAASP